MVDRYLAFPLINGIGCSLEPQGDGFYGTPSLPWGNGFNVNPGDTVHFSFTSVGIISTRYRRISDLPWHENKVWDRVDMHAF